MLTGEFLISILFFLSFWGRYQGYPCDNTITFQDVLSEGQIDSFFIL